MQFLHEDLSQPAHLEFAFLGCDVELIQHPLARFIIPADAGQVTGQAFLACPLLQGAPFSCKGKTG